MKLGDLKADDRVYRWWDAGSTVDLQPLTVVRVNRKTVTVRTDQGNSFRTSPENLTGFYTDDIP
jgi:hypothetical protein